jgi:hypothetical protein
LVTSVIKTKHTDRDKGGGGVTECQYRTDQIWITGCVEFEKANENIELSSFSVVAFFYKGQIHFVRRQQFPPPSVKNACYAIIIVIRSDNIPNKDILHRICSNRAWEFSFGCRQFVNACI